MVLRAAVAIGVAACAAAPALAQFSTPASTNLREKIVGAFVPGDSGITPEGGDQIGAFAQNKIIGVFQFDSGTDGSFSITLFGDDPDTEEKEGPNPGAKTTFRFFDLSTNEEISLAVLNAQGEKVNFTFQGQEIPDLPIDLPGFDLTPSRFFDLTPGGPDDGGGDGGGGSGDKYDVNGDGRVDTKDAAMVLRAVMGAASDDVDADVNGDGAVTTADAIEVLRNR